MEHGKVGHGTVECDKVGHGTLVQWDMVLLDIVLD